MRITERIIEGLKDPQKKQFAKEATTHAVKVSPTKSHVYRFQCNEMQLKIIVRCEGKIGNDSKLNHQRLIELPMDLIPVNTEVQFLVDIKYQRGCRSNYEKKREYDDATQ